MPFVQPFLRHRSPAMAEPHCSMRKAPGNYTPIDRVPGIGISA
jgi:hypothetical protein